MSNLIKTNHIIADFYLKTNPDFKQSLINHSHCQNDTTITFAFYEKGVGFNHQIKNKIESHFALIVENDNNKYQIIANDANLIALTFSSTWWLMTRLTTGSYDLDHLLYQIQGDSHQSKQNFSFYWKFSKPHYAYSDAQLDVIKEIINLLFFKTYQFKDWIKIIKNKLLEKRLNCYHLQIATVVMINPEKISQLSIKIYYRFKAQETFVILDLLNDLLNNQEDFKRYLENINPKKILTDVYALTNTTKQYLLANPKFYDQLVSLANQFVQIEEINFGSYENIKNTEFYLVFTFWDQVLDRAEVREIRTKFPQLLINDCLWKQLLVLSDYDNEKHSHNLEHYYLIDHQSYCFNIENHHGSIFRFYWKFSKALTSYSDLQLRTYVKIWQQIITNKLYQQLIKNSNSYQTKTLDFYFSFNKKQAKIVVKTKQQKLKKSSILTIINDHLKIINAQIISSKLIDLIT